MSSTRLVYLNMPSAQISLSNYCHGWLPAGVVVRPAACISQQCAFYLSINYGLRRGAASHSGESVLPTKCHHSTVKKAAAQRTNYVATGVSPLKLSLGRNAITNFDRRPASRICWNAHLDPEMVDLDIVQTTTPLVLRLEHGSH